MRVLVPVTALLAGLLFATSASTADGTELRSGRRLQLTELIGEEQRKVAQQEAVAARLRTEVARAADVGARLVGVNARDLSTFELDRDLFGRLADRIPADAVKIAESAVLQPDDVAHYRRAGADVVLVGEALVTGDPIATLRDFLAVPA